MLCDYHTHTLLCRHAEGWPIDYAAAAAARGLTELGCADHSPMPEDEFDDWRMLRSDLPRYVDSVEEARAAHPGLPIRLGLEVDYLDEAGAWLDALEGMAQWDYLIGSVHYLPGGWDVDNPKWLSLGRWETQTIEEVWDAYFAAYERCIRSRRFEFCAHPDLVKKFGHVPPVDLRRYYDRVAQAVVDTGTILELNTSGWHKPVAEAYPGVDFLTVLAQTGTPIVLSSDAHRPEDVGRDFDRALALARAAGFTHTAQFVDRDRRLRPLPETTAP
ncbi:MAG: histidinol-phosphatase [Verrucomicrobiales bacterium]